MLVRPANTIMMFLPKSSATLAWPTRNPSPAATISVIETMPQAMPNIVKNVRTLCAHRVRSVSRTRSRKLTYCRMILSPCFSPATSSVFTPLEMPVCTATCRRPFSWVGSGTSTKVLRSLS